MTVVIHSAKRRIHEDTGCGLTGIGGLNGMPLCIAQTFWADDNSRIDDSMPAQRGGGKRHVAGEMLPHQDDAAFPMPGHQSIDMDVGCPMAG